MDNITRIDTSQEKSMMYLYIYLLKKHDFYWRQSDDTRYLERNIERENQIQKLKYLIDPTGIIYNQYAPTK